MKNAAKFSPINSLADALLLIAGLVLMAMMLHITADVAMKFFFRQPLPGTLEIVSSYYMVGCVFLPIAALELARASIAVDAIFIFMPRWMKLACIFLVLIGSTAVYLGLAWTSWGDALRSLANREVMMGTVFVSVWPGRFVLPVSFLLGGLACFWHLVRFMVSAEARTQLIAHADIEETV